MNNWLLLFLLIAQYYISYALHCRRFGPSNIFVLAIMAPTLILVLMHGYIQYEISFDSVIIIFILVLLFQIGESVSLAINNDIKEGTKYVLKVIVDRKFAILAVAFQLFYLYSGYKYIMQVGALYGANDIMGAYAANRLNMVAAQRMESVDIQPSTLYIFCMYIANSIEIICLHVVLIQKIVEKKKADRLLLLAILLFYCTTLLFQTGRAAYIPFIIHLFYLVIFFKGVSIRVFIKQNKFLIGLSVAVIFALFFVSGTMRSVENIDKTNDVDMIDPAYTVSAYVGAPIIGFDLYVNKGMERYNIIGEHLFKGVYNIIRRLGVELERPKVHQDFYQLKNFESNAYLGITYWIKDFSLFGAMIYSIILGSIFGLVYVFEKKNLIRINNITACYFVAMLYYALIMTFFGDMFSLFFSFDFYFQLFVIYLITKLKLVKFFQYKIQSTI